jgi:hypothetical protein
MRRSRVLLAVLSLACSVPTAQSEGLGEVSFRLDGELQQFRQNTSGVSLSVRGAWFTLSVADYLREQDLSLEISLQHYQGVGTYPLGDADDRARLAIGEQVYETTGSQGRGTLTVTEASCRTEVATDPATGITGDFEICHARGTFSLVGVSQSGETVTLTEGTFRGTSVQGA